MENKGQAKKLPLLAKCSYGLVGAANMITSVITNTYLIFFYTNALGFSGSLAGTLSLIGSVWGWFCTAGSGAIIDRTGSKSGGKCRNYIIKFLIPAAVLLALSFTVPEMSTPMTAAWVLVAYCARVIIWSFVQMPATTLMGRITDNPVDRANLNQIYTILATGGSLLSVAITMPIVSSFGEDMASVRKGFMVIAIIYAVVFALLYFVAYIGTKGYEPEQEFFEGDNLNDAKKPSVIQIFKGVVANKMCLIAVALYLVDLIGCMMESSAMSYYFQYNLGNMGLFAIYSTLSVIPAMIAYVAVGFFVKRLGNSGTAVLGGAIAAAAYLVRFIMQDQSIYQWGACVAIACFGSGLIACVSILCVFDSKVYGEWKLGVNAEGILMAAYSLANTIGLAIGRALAGYLLDTVPYDPNVAEQAASVTKLFLIESTLAPCLGFCLVVVLGFVLKKYEKKLPEWKAEIEKRNQETA